MELIEFTDVAQDTFAVRKSDIVSVCRPSALSGKSCRVLITGGALVIVSHETAAELVAKLQES